MRRLFFFGWDCKSLLSAILEGLNCYKRARRRFEPNTGRLSYDLVVDGLLILAYHCFDRVVIPESERPVAAGSGGSLFPGCRIFRASWENAFIKQYEKFSTFLRNEVCSNNFTDFGLKKGLSHLEAVRRKFLEVTDRFAGFETQGLNIWRTSY